MKAMVLHQLCRLEENSSPLKQVEMPAPVPSEGEIRVKVSACGVCHTELDEIEGRTPPPHLPVIPGHQVVGIVEENGKNAHAFRVGDRVGIGWIFSACGTCGFCRTGNDNLCPSFKATGRDAHGGYAQYMSVPENYAYAIPDGFSDTEAAPLLCAGAVGYRSLKLTGMADGHTIGLTGFGASGHLVLKMVKYRFPNSSIFVFARSEKERDFALELGACWAGESADQPPEKLNCIIDTTPVWGPIVDALTHLAPGGRLVINAIRKEETDKKQLLKLDYPTHLWMEKEIKSVANVSRKDVKEFLALAGKMNIKPVVQEFSLEDANQALVELKTRKIRGAKVLKVD